MYIYKALKQNFVTNLITLHVQKLGSVTSAKVFWNTDDIALLGQEWSNSITLEINIRQNKALVISTAKQEMSLLPSANKYVVVVNFEYLGT